MGRKAASYDEQAKGFDERAGLSDAVAREVVVAVRRHFLASTRGAILEIGAGTGELGHWLATERTYIGIDSSAAMLAEYRRRRRPSANQSLVCTDGNDPWPAQSGTVGLVFGSRVFHLLHIDHVVTEFERVGSPAGATLLSGRVKREKDSVKTLVRQKMRELLVAEGYEPRQSERDRSRLLDRLVADGAVLLERLDAATWATTHRPIDSIRGWRGKSTMGGVTPDPEVKTHVLSALEKWALETFGDLSRPVSTREIYQLEGVHRIGKPTL